MPNISSTLPARSARPRPGSTRASRADVGPEISEGAAGRPARPDQVQGGRTASVDYERGSADRGSHAMRRIAVVGNLEALSCFHRERSTVPQFDNDLAAEQIEHVAPVAPMVGEIARPIFDHPNPQIAHRRGSGKTAPGRSRRYRRGQLGKFGDREGRRRDFHAFYRGLK
jgi:hypothetical protein